MHFPYIAGFHYDAYLSTQSFADKVVVYSSGSQQ